MTERNLPIAFWKISKKKIWKTKRETKTPKTSIPIMKNLKGSENERKKAKKKKFKKKNCRLKQRRTNTLIAVSRKRIDINKLMTDRRNLDVVKAELNQLDSLCQQFHDAHNLFYDELATPEEREIASRLMTRKVKFSSTARKFLIGDLELEARISDNLERLPD
ncbi:unnamed protein product [Porites evermanni]|uniref:Uncharacterized protein n=1 Tax=Porites evermanni TaxID=104178 RepID=A0ABN8LDF1_9CNID|nr:unnamed protein product [Porites evermanni]